jgi:hypothetical protein
MGMNYFLATYAGLRESNECRDLIVMKCTRRQQSVRLTVTVMVPVAVAAVLLPRRMVQPFVRRACFVMSVVTKAGENALE